MASIDEKYQGSKVIVTIEADTKNVLEGMVASYLNAYHPAGYSTRFDPLIETADGWMAKGFRYNSCD